jgi:hypothetical protein
VLGLAGLGGAALVLLAAAEPVGAALRVATLPVVVVAAATGAALAVGGVIVLLAGERGHTP